MHSARDEAGPRGGRYLAQRLVFAAVTVFVAVSLNFVIFRALPGTAVSDLSRLSGATPAAKAQLAEQFGIDKSPAEQYVIYLGQLARGNLGISFADNQPVAGKLGVALANTVPMVALGTLAAIVLGIVSGAVAAWRRGTLTDRGVSGVALGLFALPAQWLGLMLLIVFAGVLPGGGIADDFLVDPSFGERTADFLAHVTLPSLTLGLGLYGSYVLIVRSAVLETLGEQYVLTARAKGLRPTAILRRHVLRNAMLPTVTLIALSLGYVVTGAVLVETVFSWPGVGRALYDAVRGRDYPVLQGGFLLLTVSVVVFTLLADLLYVRLDPRVRR